MPSPTFIESGTAATGDFSFWGTTVGSVSSDTTVVHTGTRSLKLSSGSPSTSASVRTGAVLSTRRRISFWFRFDTTPTGNNTFFTFYDNFGLPIARLVLGTGRTIYLQDRSLFWTAYADVGVSVAPQLEASTWYRISIGFEAIAVNNYTIKVYLNGGLYLTADPFDGNLGGFPMTMIEFNIVGSATPVNSNYWFSDIWVDDGTDLTDPGDMRVLSRRPFSNGSLTNFTTQIGAGGSGYGTGHTPQVNEVALSTTNGWSMVGAGAAVTEEYNLEPRDNNLDVVSDRAIVAVQGWIYAKSSGTQTASIIVDGTTTASISLLTSPVLFTKDSAFTRYPLGTGADIGIVTTTALQTVSLYEAGVLIVVNASLSLKYQRMAFKKPWPFSPGKAR